MIQWVPARTCLTTLQSIEERLSSRIGDPVFQPDLYLDIRIVECPTKFTGGAEKKQRGFEEDIPASGRIANISYHFITALFDKMSMFQKMSIDLSSLP